MDSPIFNNIEIDDVNEMLNCFKAVTLKYKKETTILSNVANTTQIGILKSGKANIIRYNYNGTRTIIETLGVGDTFGSFSASFDDLYIISTEDAEVILFDYAKLINRCKKNCEYHNKMIDNMLQIMGDKLKNYNERVEILTKKTIRDKVLTYLNTLSKKQISRNITLPFSLTDLADYLSIDRSAMMRELKNLKEEGLIEAKGKKIHLLY